MRVMILAGALALTLVSPAAAQMAVPGASATGSSVVRPEPPRRAARPLSVRADNEKALQESNARQKRWDERMRRATGSMCDRC